MIDPVTDSKFCFHMETSEAKLKRVVRSQCDGFAIGVTTHVRKAVIVIRGVATAVTSHNLTMQLATDRAKMGSRNVSVEFEMTHLLGLAIALLLLGGGVWVNFYVGSLSQEKGSWVAHSH
jgi:hypothetical protein